MVRIVNVILCDNIYDPYLIFTAFVPGVTVKLCMMNNMRCHTAMRPAVIVICVILAIVTAVDIVIQKKKEDAGK